MRKAVRELIRARQPHTTDFVQHVKVEQVGSGRAKDCFNNSVVFAEQNTERSRYKIVSGWLVGEFDATANGTAIIQHYWNYDTVLNQYLDLTPNIDDTMKYHYVVDTDLMAYSQQPHIYEIIDDCVGHSIWFSEGKFSLVTKPFLTHIPIGDTACLTTDLFYMNFSDVDKINYALKQMECA